MVAVAAALASHPDLLVMMNRPPALIRPRDSACAISIQSRRRARSHVPERRSGRHLASARHQHDEHSDERPPLARLCAGRASGPARSVGGGRHAGAAEKASGQTFRCAGPVAGCVAGLVTALKTARGEPVLKHVDFEIRAGEVVALIGRNGAGKTTLFKALLGLAKRTAGTIIIDATRPLPGRSPPVRARSPTSRRTCATSSSI